MSRKQWLRFWFFRSLLSDFRFLIAHQQRTSKKVSIPGIFLYANCAVLCVKKKNQLDVTECFISLMICSTCFGEFYAHHQELKTIYVLLPHMVCSARLLVVGGQMQGSRLCVQEEGCCTTAVVQHPSSWTDSLLSCTWSPTTSNQVLHTIGGNNTHIVSSSWWWT